MKTTNDTIGRQDRLKGGVLSFGLPRSQAMTMDGMTLSPAQGVAEAVNFEGAGAGKAGHHRRFVLIAEEVNPVISALEELASASTPEQSLSSTIGIATDLRRLLQRRHFRVAPGRSEPRSKNPGFQSSTPGAHPRDGSRHRSGVNTGAGGKR